MSDYRMSDLIVPAKYKSMHEARLNRFQEAQDFLLAEQEPVGSELIEAIVQFPADISMTSAKSILLIKSGIALTDLFKEQWQGKTILFNSGQTINGTPIFKSDVFELDGLGESTIFVEFHIGSTSIQVRSKLESRNPLARRVDITDHETCQLVLEWLRNQKDNHAAAS